MTFVFGVPTGLTKAELITAGYQNKNVIKIELQGGGQENFNTKAYLMGEYQGVPGKPKKGGFG